MVVDPASAPPFRLARIRRQQRGVVPVARASRLGVCQPGSRGLDQAEVNAGRRRRFGDQLGILAGEREREARRVVAPFDRVSSALGLTSERRRRQELVNGALGEPERVGERDRLTQRRECAEERRVGDQLRRLAGAEWTDVEDGTEA
jgi:hypothetical protein